MALIDITNEVLRATGQRANKTAFAETDSTSYIRDRINDALDLIYGLRPFQIKTAGSITLPASTRTVSGPLGLDISRIDKDSFRIHNSAGDIPLAYVTDDYIRQNYPSFETKEAEEPRYVYFDGADLAFHPLLKAGASSLTIQFDYWTQFTKLTATDATVPFEERSDEMRFIKLYAQMRYEIHKGLGQPGVTNDDVKDVKAKLVAKYAKTKKVGFTGNRRY